MSDEGSRAEVPSLRMTDRAQAALEKQLKDAGRPLVVRVVGIFDLKRRDHSPFSFRLIAEAGVEGDLAYRYRGLIVFVDVSGDRFPDGTEMDFAEHHAGSGFFVNVKGADS